MIVLLFIDAIRGACVGAYISAHVVLTAAHCIAPSGYEQNTLRLNDGNKIVSIRIANEWASHQWTKYDFAFIHTLEGATHITPVGSPDNLAISIATYVGTFHGNLILRSPDYTYVSVLTEPGMSGSPILNSRREIISLVSDNSPSYTAGPNITQDTLRAYNIPTTSPSPTPSPTPVRQIKKGYTVRVPLGWKLN